jgi:hypothetical protein
LWTADAFGHRDDAHSEIERRWWWVATTR